MSTNKKLCLRSHSNKRRSFSQRIWEDFCPEILQYLSLEDQLRLECVSKQFQRTITLSKTCLIINFKAHEENGLKRLESLLKKFPNINEIVFRTDNRLFIEELRYDDAIDLIIKNCKCLKRFEFDRFKVNQKTFKRFLAKFGPKLAQISLPKQLMTTFVSSTKVSNIEKLVIRGFSYQLSVIQFNRLQDIQVISLCDKDLDPFERFAEVNRKNIKYLSFICDHLSNDMNNKRVLKIISKFNNLVHLNFGPILQLNDSKFDEQFKQIIFNCNQLKSIDCSLRIQPNDSKTISDYLSPLKQFKRLKRLYFNIPPFNTTNKQQLEKLDRFSFEAFKGFQDLTHLKINLIGFYNLIPEKVLLKDIDINLPNLQYLKIKASLDATQWTVDVLSRLPRLQTIELNIVDERLIPDIENEVIDNCVKISKIKLFDFKHNYFLPNNTNQ